MQFILGDPFVTKKLYTRHSDALPFNDIYYQINLIKYASNGDQPFLNLSKRNSLT